MSKVNNPFIIKSGALDLLRDNSVEKLQGTLRAASFTLSALGQFPSFPDDDELPPCLPREVLARKPLELSIGGGADTRHPLFISAMSHTKKRGDLLVVGDEILAIDNVCLRDIQNEAAVKIINDAISSRKEIKFLVKFNPQLRAGLTGAYLSGNIARSTLEKFRHVKSNDITIPVALCQISDSYKDFPTALPYNNTVFLLKPEVGRLSGIYFLLRARSVVEKNEWMKGLYIARDSCPGLSILKPSPSGYNGHLKKLSRLEMLSQDGCRWGTIFLALTDFDLSIYLQPPLTCDDLSESEGSFPLLSINCIAIHEKSNANHYMLSIRGVSKTPLLLRTETLDLRDEWISIIKENTTICAKTLKSVAYSIIFANDNCEFVIDIENGLSLNKLSEVIWRFPYGSLKNTRHIPDQNELVLDFGSGGVKTLSILESRASNIVFVLFSFVRAHCDISLKGHVNK